MAEEILQTFRSLGSIFGILEKEISEEELPIEVKRLIQLREEARKKRDWETADMIRGEIKGLGYLLEDTSDGAKWRRISDYTE